MSGTKNHRGWGWIRKRASGRWQASYVGPDGRRHFAPTTFEKKMDAEEWLSRERREIQTALNNLSGANNNTAAFKLQWLSPTERVAAVLAAESSRETLDQYGTRWIALRSIKPRTRIHYDVLLKRHISPKLGTLAVSNLTPLRCGVGTPRR
jgi:hypothetical protein